MAVGRYNVVMRKRSIRQVDKRVVSEVYGEQGGTSSIYRKKQGSNKVGTFPWVLQGMEGGGDGSVCSCSGGGSSVRRHYNVDGQGGGGQKAHR